MMLKNHNNAMRFVNDYFQMEYKSFLSKYFNDDRLKEINLNITPQKYKQIFENLSDKQKEIIVDDTSKYIVVTAGPGSGKTRVLVHKLASLMLLEDVKHEQLLMLTFSRSAAMEFRQRLTELIGNATRHIEIKTFHSYCFDLLGKVGSIEDSKDIVKIAGNMIRNGEVEVGRITKTVVVIDEAQDMDINEYLLVQALMERNEDMRVIAVGDDDQNIYEFRGSSSEHLKSLITDYNAKQYNLVDNYRSCRSIIDVSNRFANIIPNRLKTENIRYVSDKEGIVQFVKHKQKVYLEYPIVEAIKNRNDRRNICVLTKSNEEAMRVAGLLNKEGISAKLIQDEGNFNVYNLAELRYFIKKVFSNNNNPTISEDNWNNALIMLQNKYSTSECLDLCLKILNKFADKNPKKYKTDLKIFLEESDLSDFYDISNEDVIVSTIHKSKGREFNAVYMLLDNVSIGSAEDKRTIYVGFTRAKNELYLHYNNSNFDRFANSKIIIDNADYPEPKEIAQQLWLKDIYLGFDANKENKSLILNLKSGDELKFYNNILFYKRTEVGKLSKSCQENIQKLLDKNYYISKVKIKFIVAWRNKDRKDDEESAIILPKIYFKKIIKLPSVREG